MTADYRRFWWWWLALVIVGVAGLGAVSTLWDLWLPWRRVGTVGEWIAAIGTVAAVIAAMDAARRAEHRGETERRATRESARVAEMERRIEDARSVIASDAKVRQNTVRRADGVRGFELVASVSNGAPRPIRSVRTHLLWGIASDVVPTEREAGDTIITETTAAAMRAGQVLVDCPAGSIRQSEFATGKIKAFAVQFFDVHGDEWIGGFGDLFGNGSIIGLHAANSSLWGDDAGAQHAVYLRGGDWATPDGSKGGIVVGVKSDTTE